MSLEKILERIKADAQGEADNIRNRASASAEEITKKAQADAEKLKAEALESAKITAEQHKERIISTAQLDLRKQLLAEKQKAIDSAFQEAMNNIINMDDAQYREFLKKMIVPSVQTGSEEIILCERDKARLGKSFLKELNREISSGGGSGNLTISQDTYDMLGGFVLRRGKIEINGSLESIFGSSRDDLETEVAKILFPESS